MEYTVKFKRIDTGKPWIGGNIKEGKFGPQLSMKMTKELKAFIDAAGDSGWLNFNLYKPFEEKPKSQASDEESINF